MDPGLHHLEKCAYDHSPEGVVGTAIVGSSTKRKKGKQQKSNVKSVHLVRSLQLIVHITATTIMKSTHTCTS